MDFQQNRELELKTLVVQKVAKCNFIFFCFCFLRTVASSVSQPRFHQVCIQGPLGELNCLF